jgi:hypothetical protein
VNFLRNRFSYHFGGPFMPAVFVLILTPFSLIHPGDTVICEPAFCWRCPPAGPRRYAHDRVLNARFASAMGGHYPVSDQRQPTGFLLFRTSSRPEKRQHTPDAPSVQTAARPLVACPDTSIVCVVNKTLTKSTCGYAYSTPGFGFLLLSQKNCSLFSLIHVICLDFFFAPLM